MNPTLMDQFSEACGAAGPLIIDLSDDGQTHRARRIFHQPFLVAGRHPGADLELRHEQVRRRHCYLQMVGGHLFGIDLGSRSGLRVDGQPRRMAWTDRSREVRVGPVGMVLRGGDAGGNAPPVDAPSPLSARYAREHPVPGAALEIASAGTEAHRWRMTRVLVLIGRSPACKVKLISPLVSEIHCALLRTPQGVWLVDLLSRGGVSVNGARTSLSRLEEGDEVGVGPFTIRLSYEASPRSRQDRGLAGDRPGCAAAEPVAGLATAVGDPSPILRPSDEAAEAMQDDLRRTLLMTGTVGAIHCDQMDVARQEHEAIRRLAEEVYALRIELTSHSPADAVLGGREPFGHPSATGACHEPGPSEDGRVCWRRDPRELHEIASQFLTAYRLEQGSLRERILRILFGAAASVGTGSRA